LELLLIRTAAEELLLIGTGTGTDEDGEKTTAS